MLRQDQQSALNQQLEEALTNRSVIDQAIGLLMGQQRCAAPEAFDLLRQNSQHNNRKLRDVAADLITRVTGMPPARGSSFVRVAKVTPAVADAAPDHGDQRQESPHGSPWSGSGRGR